jgi:hypothetical protein
MNNADITSSGQPRVPVDNITKQLPNTSQDCYSYTHSFGSSMKGDDLVISLTTISFPGTTLAMGHKLSVKQLC